MYYVQEDTDTISLSLSKLCCQEALPTGQAFSFAILAFLCGKRDRPQERESEREREREREREMGEGGSSEAAEMQGKRERTAA